MFRYIRRKIRKFNQDAKKVTIKKVLQLLLLIAAICVVYLCVSEFYNYEKYDLKKHSGETICEVIDYGSRRSVIAEYEVKGEFYEHKERGYIPLSYIPIGEKYVLYYRLNDPEDCMIDFSQPVFIEGEHTAETTGELIDITDRNVCRYRYVVGEYEYESFKKMPDDFIPVLNKTYKIRYLTKDPYRFKILIEP